MTDENNGASRLLSAPTQRTMFPCSQAVGAQVDRYGGRSHEGAAKVGHYRWKLTYHDTCTITLAECQSTSAPFLARM